MPKDDIRPETLRDAIWSLGPQWRSALAYGSGWTSGSYAGAVTGRGMVWDDACTLPERADPGCFRYGTPELPFAGAPPAAVPTATTAP
jgi:hypothetical protein